MCKRLFTAFILLFLLIQAKAQIGAKKLVGPGTKDYSLGFGAFIKMGVPVSDGDDVTLEGGVDIFPLKGYGLDYGTIMTPLKLGYRYTLDRTGQGFYVEPQLGYNVYGLSALPDDNGNDVELKYHGIVLAAGAGYLFTVGGSPVDLNLRYETVIAHGGSNNSISLGISRYFSFGKRNSD